MYGVHCLMHEILPCKLLIQVLCITDHLFLQTNEALLEILDDCDDFNLDSEAQAGITTDMNSYFPLLRLYTFSLFFSFLFQTLFRVSDTAMNILLKFLSMFFSSVGKRVSSLPANFCLARQSLLCTKIRQY